MQLSLYSYQLAIEDSKVNEVAIASNYHLTGLAMPTQPQISATVATERTLLKSFS